MCQPLPRIPLLHVCCAPCSGPIIERVIADGSRPLIIFYNPNIYPLQEYQFRKASVMKLALKKGLEIVDIDNDPDRWASRVQGLEAEPERGRRCEACFDLRLERTALFAKENGHSSFATTCGIARWKDIEQVNRCGLKAASRYPGVEFLPLNWKQAGLGEQIYLISKKEKFYKQEYCGCLFSLDQANKRRAAADLPPIVPGQNYFYS